MNLHNNVEITGLASSVLNKTEAALQQNGFFMPVIDQEDKHSYPSETTKARLGIAVRKGILTHKTAAEAEWLIGTCVKDGMLGGKGAGLPISDADIDRAKLAESLVIADIAAYTN